MKTLISSAVGMSMLAMAISGCGTVLGTGVGAAAGAIYDITKKN